eukprot:SAG31_NODE_2267_length_6052_cov_7.222241_6_plen_50_part_00
MGESEGKVPQKRESNTPHRFLFCSLLGDRLLPDIFQTVKEELLDVGALA